MSAATSVTFALMENVKIHWECSDVDVTRDLNKMLQEETVQVNC
jgi:hypothetical protein